MTDDALTLYRLRVRYQKDGRLAFLGHLELINTINRCIRRSGLPFSVGNGFARRIRIQFSQALPVGASSSCEYFDIMLTDHVPAEDALSALRRSTPRALVPVEAGYLPHRVTALEAWADRSRWDLVASGGGIDADALGTAFETLRRRGNLDYDRQGKPKHIDVSKTLVGWSFLEVEDGLGCVLDTRSTNDGALRPQILVNAALREPGLEGARLSNLRVRRCGLWHEDEDGRLVEPLDGSLEHIVWD